MYKGRNRSFRKVFSSLVCIILIIVGCQTGINQVGSNTSSHSKNVYQSSSFKQISHTPSHKQTIIMPSYAKTHTLIRLNQGNFGTKNISGNLVPKTYLSPQVFVRQSGTPLTETKTFSVHQADLKPQSTFTLNLVNGSPSYDRVSSATVTLNGQILFSQNQV